MGSMLAARMSAVEPHGYGVSARLGPAFTCRVVWDLGAPVPGAAAAAAAAAAWSQWVLCLVSWSGCVCSQGGGILSLMPGPCLVSWGIGVAWAARREVQGEGALRV